MNCTNKKMKDLLSAYAAEKLEDGELAGVEDHLRNCGDCRAEAELLSMLTEETVPEPGAAFWAAMPDRIYTEVLRQNASRSTARRSRRLDVSVLLRALLFPRWSWAASAVVIVLLATVFALNPRLRENAAPLSSGEEYSSEDMNAADAALNHGSINLAELTSSEFDALSAWAGQELSAIALETVPVIVHGWEVDPYEELAELNGPEIERLSKMLEKLQKEV